MKIALITFLACLLVFTTCTFAEEPEFVLAGDGLTVRVMQWDSTGGTVRGEIVRGAQTFAFTGIHYEIEGGAEIVKGTFMAGEDSFDFSTRQDETTGDAVLLTTGGKTFRLVPQKKEVKNPLAKEEKSGDAKLPPVLKLKQVAFPDVSMGVQTAYTALIPSDWTAQGQIEWQPVGEALFPQQKIEITSPGKGRIRFIPQATISYLESAIAPPQGIAPPENFPQWLADNVEKFNDKVSNVKLVSSARNEKLEAFYKEVDRQTNAIKNGMRREAHVITLDYDEDGVRRREELAITYVRYAPIVNQNINSQMWSLFTSQTVSAPAETFEKHKAELYSVVGTVRPTPQWYTHSQKLIAEMSQRRAADKWKQILDRGRQIDQMTDSDYAKYKKDMSAGHSAQRTRINTIYETDDYRDTDGKTVNLPMHYKHVFSDGKGNYVLSNNSLDKPGALWEPIEPAGNN